MKKRLRASTASERPGITCKEGGLGARSSFFGREDNGGSKEGYAGADRAKVTMTASVDRCSAEGNEGDHKNVNKVVRKPGGMIRDCLRHRQGKSEWCELVWACVGEK